MTRDVVRVAAGRHARTLALAVLLGIFVCGCESGQIAAPVSTGVVWTRITDPSSAPRPFYPAWRGDRIAFESVINVTISGSTVTLSSLKVANSDGSNLISFPSGLNSEAAPRWTDDSTLVFTSNRAGSFDLWYRTLSGATLRRLTDFPGNEWDPAPRPGTPGLAYIEGAKEYQGRIALIPDSAATPLDRVYLTPSEIAAGEPDWDPAGQRLCFSADSADGSRHIWILGLGSGDTLAVQLTTGPFHDSSPHFSPDGSTILFASDRTGRSGLWTVDPGGEGIGLRLIGFADAGLDLYSPYWSPDGTRIVVSSGGSSIPRALWILSNLPAP